MDDKRKRKVNEKDVGSDAPTAKKRKDSKASNKTLLDNTIANRRSNEIVVMDQHRNVVYQLTRKHTVVNPAQYDAEPKTAQNVVAINRESVHVQGNLTIVGFVPLRASPLGAAIAPSELRKGLQNLRLVGTSVWAATTAPRPTIAKAIDAKAEDVNAKVAKPEDASKTITTSDTSLRNELLKGDDKLASIENPNAKDDGETTMDATQKSKTKTKAKSSDEKKSTTTRRQPKFPTESECFVAVRDSRGITYPMTMYTLAELVANGFSNTQLEDWVIKSPNHQGWILWTEEDRTFLIPYAWVAGLQGDAVQAKSDAVKDDALKDDSVKDDSVKDDSVKDDSVKDDSVKDETVKSEKGETIKSDTTAVESNLLADVTHSGNLLADVTPAVASLLS